MGKKNYRFKKRPHIVIIFEITSQLNTGTAIKKLPL